MSDALDGRSATTAGAAKRRHPVRLVIGVLLALLLLYIASPYYSFWRFTQALRAKDRARIESQVDFRSVRDSLKRQLRGQVPAASRDKQDAFAGLVQRLAPSLIDQLVDAFITPEGLAALIADRELAEQAKAKNPGAIVRINSDAARDLAWDSVNYAFFTGARRFLVDVQGTRLHWKFSRFRWVLEAVELPLDDGKQ
jgi:hypothetical protein